MANNQNISQRNNDDFHFDLMEHIGVLGKRDNGWTKEVNIVSWNGCKAKVDIRDWDPNHTRMTKGITLFEEEAEMLADALARRYGLKYRRDETANETGHEARAEEIRGEMQNEEIHAEAEQGVAAVAENAETSLS